VPSLTVTSAWADAGDVCEPRTPLADGPDQREGREDEQGEGEAKAERRALDPSGILGVLPGELAPGCADVGVEDNATEGQRGGHGARM
jgi:hypothetical protein